MIASGDHDVLQSESYIPNRSEGCNLRISKIMNEGWRNDV